MAPSHRSCLSVRSTLKQRRSASRIAILARWKKVSTPSRPRKPANDRVVGARVNIDLRYLSKGIEELSIHNVDCRGQCSKGSKKDGSCFHLGAGM